jgi:hypothetical protein
MTSFAYLHARPETSSVAGIFYVGKGNTLKRAKSLGGRNKYHAALVSKYGAENVLVGTIECSTEAIAFDLEKGLIKCLQRMGVKLSNMSSGGEGPSGVPASAKQRERMKEINATFSSDQRKAFRAKEPLDTNSRRSKTVTANWEKKSSAEKAAIAAKLSEINLSSWSNPEVRAKRIAGMRGKKKTMSVAALEARKKNAASRYKERK